MKTSISYSLIAAAMACGFANGQTTAYTTPVGYISSTVNTQSGASNLTLVGPSLVQPTVFAGASTVTPSGGSVVTFLSGVPTTLGSLYVLEITSGPSEGWWSTVSSSTATTITVNDAFPAALPAGTTISVRLHNTIQSFLGENTPNLIPFDGSTGDEVQILNPDQSIISIAYIPASVTGAPTDDWYNLATSALADDQVIEPSSAVIIKSSRLTNSTFVSTGTVKTTKTQLDVFPGLTLVAQPAAAGATFNGMSFQTSLIPLNAEGSNTNYDELQVLNPDQSIVQYAALDPALLGFATVANLADSSDAGSTNFAQGTGQIIKRTDNPASTITIPGAVVAP